MGLDGRWRRFSAPPESNQERPRFEIPSERQNQQFLFVTSIKILGQVHQWNYFRAVVMDRSELSPSHPSSMSCQRTPVTYSYSCCSINLISKVILTEPWVREWLAQRTGLWVTSLPRQHRSNYCVQSIDLYNKPFWGISQLFVPYHFWLVLSFKWIPWLEYPAGKVLLLTPCYTACELQYKRFSVLLTCSLKMFELVLPPRHIFTTSKYT